MIGFAPARLGAAALVASAIVALAPPGTARAHDERGGVALSAVVQSVSPPIEGLSVGTLVSAAPVLELRNRTGRNVTVLGLNNEPFLRIGRQATYGNSRSVTLHRSAEAVDSPRSAARIDPRAAPRWRRLGAGEVWRWFDPRLRIRHHSGEVRSPFTVPLRVGRQRVLVRGYVVVGELGHFRSVLDRPPAITGVKVELLEGQIPGLFLRNDTNRVLHVPGTDGEPFLRIGPSGVQANTRSPTYYRAGGQAVRPVPPEAHRHARPRWTRVSPEPAWGWLELRARVAGRGQRPFALGRRTQTVRRWTTPLRLGRRAVTLSGRVDWIPTPTPHARTPQRPPPRELPAAALVAVSTAGGAGLALAMFARRHKAKNRDASREAGIGPPHGQ